MYQINIEIYLIKDYIKDIIVFITFNIIQYIIMMSLKNYILTELDNFWFVENLEVIDSLYEDLCLYYDFPLNEARGIPDNIRQDAKNIYSVCKKDYKGNNFIVEIPLSKISSVNINKLLVNVTVQDGIINGNIEYKDHKNLVFQINLMVSEDDLLNKPELVIPEIGHELVHLYVYLNHDSSKFLSRLKKISYDNLFGPYKSKPEAFIKKFIYAINEDEFNAFIAQITMEIEEQHPSDPQEAIKLLHKNDLYIAYLSLDAILQNYKNEFPVICNVYREIVSNSENLSDSQIIKKLKRRIKLIKNRLSKILPRICFESKVLILKNMYLPDLF